MTFQPCFECDNADCTDRVAAENEDQMVGSGWIMLRFPIYGINDDGQMEGEDNVLDFCSFACLEAWLEAREKVSD